MTAPSVKDYVPICEVLSSAGRPSVKQTGFVILVGWAHDMGSEKGHPMVLDTTTFLIVFSAAIVVMGLVIWLRFHLANKKQS
jgi:hypothetical protein